MLILVINLLFLIFYQTNDKKDIDLLSPEADVVIEMLGIAQTFIAFIVMYAYIQQYHGAFYQMYLAKYQSDWKQRFTIVKGSIGYAYGTGNYKQTNA